MNDYPEDLKQVYMEFGQASELAQLMEVQAGNLALSYAAFVFDPNKMTDEDREFIQSVVNDINKRTFGQLLRQIRKMGQIDDEIENTISEALTKRNYVTHHFYRFHNVAIHSENGREAMIKELREISVLFRKAHTLLSLMTNSFNKLVGLPVVTEEQAEDLIKKGTRLKI